MTADAVRARLSRLLREAGIDRAALCRLAAELAAFAPGLAADPADRPRQALLAVDLHDYYTAIETLFERVARSIDGDVPAGADWHRELLVQMASDIPGVRAALLDDDLHTWLSGLRAFRHFFRHAYGVTLANERLLQQADELQARHPVLLTRLDALLAQVDAARRGG